MSGIQMSTKNPNPKDYGNHHGHVAMGILIVALLFQAAPPLSAQSANAVPVPSQFATARTVFLASGSAPGSGTHEVLIARMVYSSFYRSLSTAGRYHLVSAPADADLSMVISADSLNEPSLQLDIYDIKTHTLLWTLDEPLLGAFREKTFQKNIDKTVAALMNDLKSLASGEVPGGPATAPNVDKK